MDTLPKPNVLFLEDDADTQKLVQFSLENAGINVFLADQVSDAWRIALTQEINLFLLDGLLPHGDSLVLCRDLRTIEPTKPILFYSGLAYKEDILKGLAAGATGYLTKPYSGDLAAEILRYIFTATQPAGSSEPVYTFQNQDETSSGDSAQISEFAAAIDRSPKTGKKSLRRRLFRQLRTASGII